MVTHTKTEFRAGWIDGAGKWRPLSASGTFDNLADAQADLEAVIARYTAPGSGVRNDIVRAVEAGRTEIRTRVVTRTDWEVA